ncbi:serine hydrolase domain-containing protein [Echinimonas agarilytica]|uniref:Beta-lactamase family protein n=1 Tax=Echinimonas agarilytica TaxID=1215918 RepID=A0AA41W460_9GAMM|nr:serine hydrolase domain-containing protein [Echinimonas agarilytica]MCM2678477.1 beta-lactamase family protein [Echinimonas agarilytica]
MPLIAVLTIVAGLLAAISMMFPAEAATTQNKSLNTLVSEFDRYFVKKMREHKVPGAAYVIVHGDQIVKIRPYGVRKQKSAAKVNAHTTFRLASVSKTFAASLATIEEQRGTFNWQDPVMLYVPELDFADQSHKQHLKVEHLLSHTAGVVPNAYDNLIEANRKLPKILPQFKKLQPMCKPGKCYAYQNVLYSMIEQVIEHGHEISYEALMQQSIFDPLGMGDASVGLDAFMSNPNHATGHLKLKRGWYPKSPKQAYYNYPAAAGVNASASDMGQWLMAQLGHFPEVIAPSVVKTMTTARAGTRKDLRRKQWRKYLSKAEYGLGWRLYQFNDEPLVYHGGWVAGYRADVAYSPERQIGIAVLLNAESHAINFVSTHFWKMVTQQSRVAMTIERHANRERPDPVSALIPHNMAQPHDSANF